MDRLKQKRELFTKLGALFGPLLNFVEHPDRYDSQEESEILARYFAECPKVSQEFHAFSKGQSGHDYAIQRSNFFNALNGVKLLLGAARPLEETIRKALGTAQDSIDAIPIPRTSVILEAGSPFTAYCRLKELCEIDATKSLVWLDPYFSADVFHRYLNSVRNQAPITLVTCEPGLNSGGRDNARWEEFLDISRLYAKENGSAQYRLIVQPTLHDRWVVFDDKRIYSLGGSVKDAGGKDYFTIASVEASQANLQQIRTQIDTGVEFFGPNTSTHR